MRSHQLPFLFIWRGQYIAAEFDFAVLFTTEKKILKHFGGPLAFGLFSGL
jgi:hypothetical protein